MKNDVVFHTVSTGARRLGLSENGLRRRVAAGELRIAARTMTGVLLFSVEDIEAARGEARGAARRGA